MKEDQNKSRKRGRTHSVGQPRCATAFAMATLASKSLAYLSPTTRLARHSAVPAFSAVHRATSLGRLWDQPRHIRNRARPTVLYESLAATEQAAPVEEVDPGEVEGTSLRIVKYPHPALRQENAEITEVDDEIKKLYKDMFKVMYAAQGVGLAAPQVGVNKRLMVFNPEGESSKWLSEAVLINPRIIEKSESTDVESEGCLSFPGMRAEVERSTWIKVQALSRTGKKMVKKYRGWEARIFQHEYDHLDGVVYPDRLTAEERAKVQPRMDELTKEHGPGGAL